MKLKTTKSYYSHVMEKNKQTWAKPLLHSYSFIQQRWIEGQFCKSH